MLPTDPSASRPAPNTNTQQHTIKSRHQPHLNRFAIVATTTSAWGRASAVGLKLKAQKVADIVLQAGQGRQEGAAQRLSRGS